MVLGNRGLSTVIALGVMLLVSLSAMIALKYAQNLEINTIRHAKRNQLLSQAKNLAEMIYNSDAIKYSSQKLTTNNVELRNCLLDTGQCQSAPFSVPIRYPDDTQTLVGSELQPTRLDEAGQLCKDQSKPTLLCPFISFSRINAICPNSQATCQKAEILNVEIIILMDPSLKNSQSIQSSYGFQISQTKALTGIQSCPANEYISSIDSSGEIKCEPVQEIFAGVLCPKGTFLNGIKDGKASCL